MLFENIPLACIERDNKINLSLHLKRRCLTFPIVVTYLKGTWRFESLCKILRLIYRQLKRISDMWCDVLLCLPSNKVASCIVFFESDNLFVQKSWIIWQPMMKDSTCYFADVGAVWPSQWPLPFGQHKQHVVHI